MDSHLSIIIFFQTIGLRSTIIFRLLYKINAFEQHILNNGLIQNSNK